MVAGGDVLDPLEVVRPYDRLGVLRPGDGEVGRRQPPRRLDQQPLQGRLTIVAVGAEVAEVEAPLGLERPVGVGVDEAVEGARAAGASA